MVWLLDSGTKLHPSNKSLHQPNSNGRSINIPYSKIPQNHESRVFEGVNIEQESLYFRPFEDLHSGANKSEIAMAGYFSYRGVAMGCMD